MQKPYGKKPYWKGNRGQGRHRRNDRIRVPQIRVIDYDGKQLGVVATADALARAKKLGLDLVEISPTARPPVCKILDYGKFKYEESKKQKSSKTPSTKLKEVKFRINIDPHDYGIKIRRGEKFLNSGCKLKVTLMFRGRDMGYKDRGFEIMRRAIEDLKLMATPDSEPRLIGRNIILTFTPLPEAKRKLVHNSGPEAEDIDDEDDDDEDDEE